MAMKNSESEHEESESSSQRGGSEEEKLTEYEKERRKRIAENKARMEALGLHRISSSLTSPTRNSLIKKKSSTFTTRSKGKRNIADDDEDYKPHDDPDTDDDDYDDDDDKDDDFGGSSRPSSKSRKSKSKVSKSSKKGSTRKQFDSERNIDDDDDDELMQAIALSLQESTSDRTPTKGEKISNIEQETTKRKRKNSFSSRWKMTEDEVILHFFQIDEAGKGMITRRDLQRMATEHDFTWTDEEIADMIKYFDSDGDGKLNLDDFHKIVGRCDMIQGSKSD